MRQPDHLSLERPNQRHNFICLLLEGTLFAWGSAFADSSTVLPVYISTLTKSSVLVGLAATLRNGGWFLPQLLVANFAARYKRKMPISIVGMVIHRSSYLLMAACVLGLSLGHPGLALTLFLFFLTTLALGDGIGGVPYIDITGKVIPDHRRGRLFGWMQASAGIMAFLSGFVIRAILGRPSIPYPQNYALIFFIGFVITVGSLVIFLMIKEPAGETHVEHSNFIEYIRLMPRYLRESPDYARMVLTRLASNSIFLTFPFYAIFARERLNLPAETVGIFVSAQMVGSVLGSLVMGHIGDRFGNRFVIRCVCALVLLPPLAALAASPAAAAGLRTLAMVLMFLPFVLIGAYFSSAWIGYTNYLIEVVPAKMRPGYAGFINTVMVLTSLLAMVGGVIVQYLGYEAAFVVNVGTAAIALALSARLREPRKAQG
ncbi:MAG TPA: MFS transporter [Bacillota bacterium]|jgi:MFS family permease